MLVRRRAFVFVAPHRPGSDRKMRRHMTKTGGSRAEQHGRSSSAVQGNMLPDSFGDEAGSARVHGGRPGCLCTLPVV